LPKNLTGTLKEAREAVENGREEENLSVVERQSNVSGINMYDQNSPNGHKSLVSANLQSQNKS
jgi:hypothetical protein